MYNTKALACVLFIMVIMVVSYEARSAGQKLGKRELLHKRAHLAAKQFMGKRAVYSFSTEIH
jgi:hypothetical protein